MGKSDKKIMTEAILQEDGKILLGRKKKKGFGHAKWIGFGGKIEKGESNKNYFLRLAARNIKKFQDGQIRK